MHINVNVQIQVQQIPIGINLKQKRKKWTPRDITVKLQIIDDKEFLNPTRKKSRPDKATLKTLTDQLQPWKPEDTGTVSPKFQEKISFKL